MSSQVDLIILLVVSETSLGVNDVSCWTLKIKVTIILKVAMQLLVWRNCIAQLKTLGLQSDLPNKGSAIPAPVSFWRNSVVTKTWPSSTIVRDCCKTGVVVVTYNLLVWLGNMRTVLKALSGIWVIDPCPPPHIVVSVILCQAASSVSYPL